MTSIELNIIKENFILKMQDIFAEDGHLLPLVVLVEENNTLFFIPNTAKNEEEDKIFKEEVRKIISEKNVVATILIAETFFTVMTIPKSLGLPTIMITNDVHKSENKKDGAILIFETKESVATIKFIVHRNPNLLKEEFRSTEKIFGLYSKLLQPLN